MSRCAYHRNAPHGRRRCRNSDHGRICKVIASKAAESSSVWLKFSATTPRGRNGLTSDSPKPGKWPSALCRQRMTRFGSRPGLVSSLQSRKAPRQCPCLIRTIGSLRAPAMPR
jgi:hypothetical protein